MLTDWLRGLRATLDGRARVRALSRRVTNLSLHPDDTLVCYLEHHPPTAIAVEELALPAAQELERQGVSVLAPLVSHGRLVGLLGLGQPAAAGVYSADDLLFLTAVANAAAPAIRVAQLLARERTRVLREDRPHAAAGLGRP